MYSTPCCFQSRVRSSYIYGLIQPPLKSLPGACVVSRGQTAIFSFLWGPVTGIFVPLKNCPRIKIFRKFLSYGIKYFVLGHKFSENFCPRTKNFRKFLSYPNKICPTSYRTKIFRKVSENFCPRIKIFSKASENFYPRTKIFRNFPENFYPIL